MNSLKAWHVSKAACNRKPLQSSHLHSQKVQYISIVSCNMKPLPYSSPIWRISHLHYQKALHAPVTISMFQRWHVPSDFFRVNYLKKVFWFKHLFFRVYILLEIGKNMLLMCSFWFISGIEQNLCSPLISFLTSNNSGK